MSRLDVYLTEHNIYASRERSRRAIREGLVSVNGKVVVKASFEVCENDVVQGGSDPVPYVSRGGLKLESVFLLWPMDVTSLQCLDVGASTGGFTQVLLSRGAASVTAVDVGHGQLAEELRADKRVINLEGTDIRGLPAAEYGGRFDFVSIDVSFISLTHVLPSVYSYMKPKSLCVALVKPQFELGRRALNKKGVVKNKAMLPKAVETVSDCARSIGFIMEKCVPSPIKGGDGNTEFLLVLTKGS